MLRVTGLSKGAWGRVSADCVCICDVCGAVATKWKTEVVIADTGAGAACRVGAGVACEVVLGALSVGLWRATKS